jgi:ferredoxin
MAPSQGGSLSEIEEGKVGRLTVRIDRLICVGFGDCIEIDPSPFRFDDEGIATLIPAAERIAEEALLEACRACPVDALSVLDAGGEQLVP